MATKKIKAPPKLSGGEVHALLKSPSSKGYSTKMANLLNFLNVTSDIRTGAEVVETGITIDQDGKLWTHEKMIERHRQDRKYSFEFVIPEQMASMLKEIDSNITNLKLELKKTRKLDKKEGLANTIDELWDDYYKLREEIGKLEDAAKVKWDSEADSETVPIEQLRESMMFYEGCKIRIDLNTGSYTFPIPVGTPFYREVCNLLKLPLPEQEAAEKPVIKRMFTLPADAFDAIKRAMKFVSGDELRPAMTCVVIEITDNKMLVVATDAHRLFKSREFEVSGPPGSHTYLLPASSLKRLPKAVSEDFSLYELKGEKVSFCGITVDLIDARYPDWRVVMPEYSNSVTFNRQDMIDNVKEVAVYANKSTAQVNFTFNGEIILSAQDVNFSFESKKRMRYLTKTMDDLTIAFNGKFFAECLGAFKSEEIIFQGASPTKAGILTDDVDTVLIMPLMSCD